MRLRFNKSDRVVLILLVVLILSYVLYSGITAKGLPSPTEVQDTILRAWRGLTPHLRLL